MTIINGVRAMITKLYAQTESGQVHGRRIQGSGETVVLLHRTPISSAGFEQVMRMLADAGFSAVALDTPGFGESFLPEGVPGTTDYATWILQALDALGVGNFHLVAHHTGSHFAAEIAAAVPDRVRSLTLSGILLAPEEERRKLRADIGYAPPIDAEGAYFAGTYRQMKGLFLDPVPDLVHAEAVGALVAGRGRDLAFDAIFDQDFANVIRTIIDEGRVPVQAVQASDDPLTLNGMLARFRDMFPTVPVTITGPAFLATPERQTGAFTRAIINFIKGDTGMDSRRHILVRGEAGYGLARADGDIPRPGPGEVVVRVRAVSLNRRDLGVRDLSYPVNGADNFTPLSDAAGDIVAVGSGVTAFKPGDRVMSTFFQNYPGGRPTLPAVLSSLGAGGPGVFADHVVLAETGVLPIPDGWTYQEAACVPCAGVTAWSALKTLGGLKSGDYVAILGTGGVALFALQIAAASGARPIILSSSADKIDRARTLGAVDGVNYRDHPQWAEPVRKLTGGMGVNHVVELGGVGTLANSIACLGLGGHLALIGALDGFGGQIDALPLIFSALRVSAVLVGSRQDHQDLLNFMVEHGIKPIIDRVFAFDDADAAYRHAATGAFGKVVITLAE
ncbi:MULTISPECIES: alpha/beta fold hydrolase [unclassified Azospirillum]|uniref:alpha/beta fold hydrolase n=1 Tax=unclassified Azospirillum TaxID=2630922 RepID=UPI000B6F0161|nr:MULTISPECIES: alpha/beta fold hydrolase [unclassified Azospirillum]SNS96965.1 NADPH:quinone reductase [Azospirillum sp. RU38E]SNT13542.1 NADPH:quinone reductase [Azospirillum sp. RU37A]